MFASQTIAAAFDSHGAHQEVDAGQNLSHRSLDESHKWHQEGTLIVANSDVDESSNSPELNQFDCHHCCHCHSPSGVYIVCYHESTLLRKDNSSVLTTKTALLSLWISPEHRPPIV